MSKINSVTFITGPTFSGANITAGTIPNNCINGTFPTLAGTQTWTGILTLTQQPVTTFTTDPGSTAKQVFGYLGLNANTATGSNGIGYKVAPSVTASTVSAFGYNIMPTGTDLTLSGLMGANIGASVTGATASLVAFGSGCYPTTTNSGTNAKSYAGYGSGSGNLTAALTLSLGSTASDNDKISSSAVGYGAVCTQPDQLMLGRTTEYCVYPGTSTTAGAAQFVGRLFLNNVAQRTTVSGSTSGTADFSQPFAGSSYKKVIIYCSALKGTASYTFPIPFLFTPQVVTATGTVANPAVPITAVTVGPGAISTTAVTINGGGGAGTTGILLLEGY